MEKIRITKIAKDLNVTHGAVSQWFSGKSKPTIDNAIKMNKIHNIPFEAWENIKSYINENISSISKDNQLQNKGSK